MIATRTDSERPPTVREIRVAAARLKAAKHRLRDAMICDLHAAGYTAESLGIGFTLSSRAVWAILVAGGPPPPAALLSPADKRLIRLDLHALPAGRGRDDALEWLTAQRTDRRRNGRAMPAGGPAAGPLDAEEAGSWDRD